MFNIYKKKITKGNTLARSLCVGLIIGAVVGVAGFLLPFTMVAAYFSSLFIEPMLEIIPVPETLFVVDAGGWFIVRFTLLGAMTVIGLFGFLGLFAGAGIGFFFKKNRNFVNSAILLFGAIFIVIIYIIIFDVTPQKCYFAINGRARDRCFMYSVNYVSAHKLKNDFCEKIHTKEDKEECYFSLATNKYNLQLCDKASHRDLCIDEVNMGIAFEDHDYSKCREIKWEDIKEKCIFNKALFLKDPKVCLEVDNKINAKRCCESISNRVNKITACDRLVGETETIISENNIEKQAQKCKDIDDEMLRNDCYYKVAKFVSGYNSFSICDRIIDSASKRRCYEEFVYPYLKQVSDSGVCDDMQNNQEAAMFCYNYLATNTFNPDVCSKIQNAFHRIPCYNNVARATKDYTICEKHENIEDKDMCYLVVSMVTDAKTCNKISDINMRSQCKNMSQKK